MQAEVDAIAKLQKDAGKQGGTNFIRNRRQLWMGQPVELLFSAQGILYSFLSQLVDRLVAQVDSVDEIRKELEEASPESPQSQPGQRPSVEDVAVQSAEFMDIFGPTSVALNMVQDRLVEMEYRIKALRADPRFFREQLHNVLAYHACVENRNLWMPIGKPKDKADRVKARHARDARTRGLTSTVVDDVMVAPHIDQSLWQSLSFQLTELHKACQDLANDPHPTEETKHKLGETVYWILSTLNTLRIRIVQKLSKMMKDDFKFWAPINHEQPGQGGVLKKERQIPYLLSCLADPGFAEVFGMHNVCEFVGNEGFDDQAFATDWHIEALEDLLSIAAVSRELFKHDAHFWQHSAYHEQLTRTTPDKDVLDRFPCYRWAAPYMVAFPAREIPSSAPEWHSDFDIKDINFVGSNFDYPEIPVSTQDFTACVEAETHHQALWDVFDNRIETHGTQENWNLEQIFEPDAIKKFITDWDSTQRFHELLLPTEKPTRTQMPSNSIESAGLEGAVSGEKSKRKQPLVAASLQTPNVDFYSHFSGTDGPLTRADFPTRTKEKVKSRPTARPPLIGDAENLPDVEQEGGVDADPPLANYFAEGKRS